jgi:antitoxin YefM
MQTISYSEARENLKAVIDKVVADRAPIAITRQRGAGAVMVSASEWASIEETLYLLRSPANAKRLLESIAELEASGGEVHEPLGGNLSGWWSRLINQEHRLVYRVAGSDTDKTLQIAQCRFVIELNQA